MPTIVEAIFLGILQGLTEWLPVSSSAHLALAQHFFGIKADVSFDIILHIGTLLAVLIYYRIEILQLFLGILERNKHSINYLLFILIAAIPTAVIGFTFKDFFESMFNDPFKIAIALFITGIILIFASKVNGQKVMTGKIALAVGVAQGIAVAPGISRSGSTISAALVLGVKREDAANFSFLAGIIPIIGAAFLEGYKSFSINVEVLPAFVGLVTSFIVGYASIKILFSFLKRSRLQWFGYYCIALAIISSVAAIFLG